MAKEINPELNNLIPLAEELTVAKVPLFISPVSAGFPFEASNEAMGVDFNKMLIKRKETTFCLRVGGDSLRGDGIFPNDLLVVDKLEEPYNNALLVCSIDGEFTTKRLEYRGDSVALMPSNPDFPVIIVHKGQIVQRWGVVLHCIKSF
ncbi:S24 family peptidase [Parabacteroides sp. PF5-9]|uniref:LexA family protein n=1 Tax=Parabacteroides sp. PF5-9 TaxID=1742404 RepID=UPI002473A017|nr:S24 family peptidase [Parabacteroides sp. PF5-9]MDH6358950.1 DNA polymerase V [Parabacteroides sp. PF5-9]